MVEQDSRRKAIVEAGRRVIGRGQQPTVSAVAREASLSRATVNRTVGSLQGLRAMLEVPPDPQSAERILEAALELIGERGLATLSMDDLAIRARVSRASLYRLFPGKSALFRELIRTYSPMEALGRLMDGLAEEPPGVVVPAVYTLLFDMYKGRAGVIRTLISEIATLQPDTREAAQLALESGLGRLLGYLVGQMQDGRLRRAHPLIALQALAGPVLFHLMTRDAVVQVLGLQLDSREAMTALADHFLRAMRPEEA